MYLLFNDTFNSTDNVEDPVIIRDPLWQFLEVQVQ
jgi:hypothetical protein